MVSNIRKFSLILLTGVIFSLSFFYLTEAVSGVPKALESERLFKGSYTHTFRNEFFICDVNIYNSLNPLLSWGEVISREESGKDGSVKKCWMIGDLKQGDNGSFTLNVRRHVFQRLDIQGNILMNKVEQVNYGIIIYPFANSSLLLKLNRQDAKPDFDINGEYITFRKYPLMSREAALYLLEKILNSLPGYGDKLQGAGMAIDGNDVAEVYIIRVIEHHPDHAVTRGIYQVDSSGTVLEYDTASNNWHLLIR